VGVPLLLLPVLPPAHPGVVPPTARLAAGRAGPLAVPAARPRAPCPPPSAAVGAHPVGAERWGAVLQ